MNLQEFSNEFDVLYNNIMSNQAPGLDEYEKSVFLTKAQNELVKDYFNPKGNKYQEGFDGSNKRQYDFSSLLRTEQLFNVSAHIDDTEKLDSRSVPFLFPNNYFLVVNEMITDTSNNKYSVLPITYDNYALKMLKPYQYPLKRQAWRIFTDKKNFNYGSININYDEEDPNKKAPIIVQSSYASDKRRLKFTLSFRAKRNGESYSILVNRILNNYDLEEIKCTVIEKSGLQLEDILLMIQDAAINGIPGEQYNDVLINTNVNVDHWDCFKLFSFPNRIEIMEIIGTPMEETEVFSVTTELQYRTIAEIIGRFKDSISNYFLRYVKIPVPIILDDFPSDSKLTIEGVSTKSECELPVECHSEILQRAVELAKSAYLGDLNSAVEMGKRSE